MKAALLSALFLVAAFAFGQSSSAAPQSVSSTVDRQDSAVESLIIGADEVMPDADFSFSPENLKIQTGDYKGVRTFALQLRHLAASHYAIESRLTGDKYSRVFIDGNRPENL